MNPENAKNKKPRKAWKIILFLGLILILGFILACVFYIIQLIRTGEWQNGQPMPNLQNSDKKADENMLKEMTKDNYWLGSANPKVTIIEFADFSCSMCENSFSNVREIGIKYKDDVKMIFKDFPVVSDDSSSLALAARCAGEQGLFWPMYDKLYINQGITEETKLIELARQTGADTTRFTTCFDSKKYATQINKDYEDGNFLKISGTPTWFINGIKVEGDIPHDTFIKIIESLLNNN